MDKSSIFISYSHEDEIWKERLVTQLQALQLQDSLDLWDDSRISAGEDWAQEIEKAITEASVSVLLISADALASKFISSKEIPPLLLRREQNDLRIVPVIVRPCPWKEVKWLASMQVRPKGGTPLDRRTEGDAEADLAAIAEEISAIIAEKKQEYEMEKDLKEELTTLTAFFTASLDMLCIVGNDGKFKRVNPAWKDTLGYTVDELVGKPFGDFIHPDDRQATDGEYVKILRGATTIFFENRYHCKDGSYKRIQWTANPRLGINDEVYEVHAAGRDITEHKRAEEDLHRFFEKSLDMLCFVDDKGNFKRVNPAWKDTLGFTSEELEGQHFKDFIHPEDLKATREEFGKLVFEGQNVICFENRYRCKNGSYKRIQWTATPTEDREVVYAVGRETTSQPSA